MSFSLPTRSFLNLDYVEQSGRYNSLTYPCLKVVLSESNRTMVSVQARFCSLDRGRTVAAALSGAWRSSPPPLELSPATLADIAPVILRTGAGGLAWWRASGAGQHDSGIALLFREAYRLHTTQSGEHEQHLKQLLRLLRHGGVEAIVCKGWATARLYPRPGLRPYGDIDLCVPPSHMTTAMAILSRDGGPAECVDLHSGVPDLEGRHWEDVVRRSRLVSLGQEEVRLLGPEDQLRQLSLHLLRHGAWRPLWLCDIGMFMESLPAGFDWDYFLHGAQRLTEWIVCALALANRLLGAQLAEPAMIRRAAKLPNWLESAVLRAWGSVLSGDSHTRDDQPMAVHLRRPIGLLTALSRRWPNPIEAAVKLQVGPSTSWPLSLLQLAFMLRRTARFVGRVPFLKKHKPLQGEMPFELHMAG